MSQKPIKTGLIGHPVSHSKSPLIHNTWIAEYRLRGDYTAIDVPCETLEEKVRKLIAEGYAGFNVTVPHKVAIMQLCSKTDDLSKTVGAVNTVIIKDGKLIGTNTDVYGFSQNLLDDHASFPFHQGPALVLGAGGSARAVVQGLTAMNLPQILIANRTRSNADELLKYASAPEKIKIIPWENRCDKEILQDINILINTTSLGMTGKNPLEMDLEHLPQKALVNDIVYAPLYTDLLKQAQKRGNPVVTGIGMLLHQARPAFHAWYGVNPTITPDLQKKVLA